MSSCSEDTGPIVTIKGDRAFANSREVAEFFGKRHDHVLEALRHLMEGSPALCPNVRAIDVEVKVGFGMRAFPTFDMDQKGFTMLAFGFTGAKAKHFKLL